VRKTAPKLLGEILVSQGKLTEKSLEAALNIQKKEGGLLGQILVKKRMVTEQEIVITLATQFGYPYLPLANCRIDTSLVKLIPLNVAIQYFCLPIDQIGKTLTVVMADPTNTLAIKDIEYTTGCRVQTFVSSSSEIIKYIQKIYKLDSPPGGADASGNHFSDVNFAGVLRKQKENKNQDDDGKKRK
jgi:type IV pilus assembly protein PilB